MQECTVYMRPVLRAFSERGREADVGALSVESCVLLWLLDGSTSLHPRHLYTIFPSRPIVLFHLLTPRQGDLVVLEHTRGSLKSRLSSSRRVGRSYDNPGPQVSPSFRWTASGMTADPG